jgi:hypothetical protein
MFYIFLYLTLILPNTLNIPNTPNSPDSPTNTDTIKPVKFSIESAIKKLNREVKPETIKMIAKVIRTKSGKYGFTKKDYPLIVAMIATESSFKHIMGDAGEVGMLQVIPSERHLKKVVIRYIKCKSTEKYCKKNGRPDVYNWKLKLSTYKVKKFLIKHPKYALETGFGEMQYWKSRFDKKLKRRYWKRFPGWYYKKKFGKEKYKLAKDKLEIWWNYSKKRLKSLVWVSSYNWGSGLGISSVARGYPFRVLRHYNLIFGKKSKTKYKVYE